MIPIFDHHAKELGLGYAHHLFANPNLAGPLLFVGPVPYPDMRQVDVQIPIAYLSKPASQPLTINQSRPPHQVRPYFISTGL